MRLGELNNFLPLSDSQVSIWRQVARASAIMVTLCQRPSGFWACPTNEEEVIWYFRNSRELAFGDYDYGSFTITWYSLLALEALYGLCPSKYIQDIQRVFSLYPPIEGAYGKLLAPGARTASYGIDPSARHTAFALLLRLRFLKNERPDDLKQTVHWLLGARTPRGGWSYRASDKREDEAFGTGVCIAALCYYLNTYDSALDSGDRSEIIKTILDAFGVLIKLRTDSGLWTGHLVGGEKDVADSAKVIDLLLLPEVYRQWTDCAPHLVNEVHDLRETLKRSARRDGWPSKFAPQAETSLSATLNALLPVLQLLLRSTEIDRQYLCTLCEGLAKRLMNRKVMVRLESADWALLGRLSAQILHSSGNRILTESERTEVNDSIFSVLNGKSFQTQVMRIALYDLPTACDGSLLYLLSKGSLSRGKMTLKNSRSALHSMPKLRKLIIKAIADRLVSYA